MRLAAALVLAACGGSQPATQAMPETMLDPASAGSGSPAAATGPSVDHACIVAGSYGVAVDLKPAAITQGNTGQSDTEWCASMLAGVASQSMGAMAIRFDGDALVIEWPAGHRATFDVLGPCEIAITSQPMLSHLTFEAGSGSGTTTFTVGTQHQGDTCTATDAALSITRAP